MRQFPLYDVAVVRLAMCPSGRGCAEGLEQVEERSIVDSSGALLLSKSGGKQQYAE
jgi:hypothetical protein